jgi:hypothetical protein
VHDWVAHYRQFWDRALTAWMLICNSSRKIS